RAPGHLSADVRDVPELALPVRHHVHGAARDLRRLPRPRDRARRERGRPLPAGPEHGRADDPRLRAARRHRREQRDPDRRPGAELPAQRRRRPGRRGDPDGRPEGDLPFRRDARAADHDEHADERRRHAAARPDARQRLRALPRSRRRRRRRALPVDDLHAAARARDARPRVRDHARGRGPPRGGERMRSLLPFTALLAFGCTVGPDYVPPEPDVPETWAEAEPDAAPAADFDLATWWEQLEDPALTRLVERSITANPDLARAFASITAVRASRGVV